MQKNQKKQAKFKITFEVRKKIKDLLPTLPQVPFLMPQVNGQLGYQQMATSQLTKGSDLIKQNPNATSTNGKGIDINKAYVSKGKKTRMMNHEVGLNEAYANDGEKGLTSYVEYINMVKSAIESKDKEDVKEDSK